VRRSTAGQHNHWRNIGQLVTIAGAPNPIKALLCENAMINFSRFWTTDVSPDEDENFDAIEPGAEVPPGAPAAEIQEWESRHKLKLPEPIRTAIGIRNGGNVRNTSIEILPLDQIVPVDDDFWEYTEISEEEAPQHQLLFIFGNETETGGTFLMNFNARGPAGEPSVYIDHHGESTYLVNQSLSAFFESEMATSPEPTVKWADAQKDADPIARVDIDLSSIYDGAHASFEQALTRGSDELILFTRERSPGIETVSRTTLPLPLDPDWAQIRPFRPAPIRTFSLHLQPVNTDGIVEKRSSKTADGQWKNATSRGTPIYVMFESADRGKLETLRAQVLGSESAAKAQAKQARDAEFQDLLANLPPAQRAAALLSEVLDFREEADRQFAAQFGEIAGMEIPPDLAGAGGAIRQQLEQMAEILREKAAATLLDPEVIKQIKPNFDEK
jgi:hypothetical protein